MISGRIKKISCLAVIFILNADYCLASANPIDIRIMGVSVKTIAERILEFLLSIAGSIALLFLVGSGILYMASNGNPDSQNKAKRMFISALAGLLVISFSYILILFVNRFLTE